MRCEVSVECAVDMYFHRHVHLVWLNGLPAGLNIETSIFLQMVPGFQLIALFYTNKHGSHPAWRLNPGCVHLWRARYSVSGLARSGKIGSVNLHGDRCCGLWINDQHTTHRDGDSGRTLHIHRRGAVILRDKEVMTGWILWCELLRSWDPWDSSSSA